jgi:chorismate dehydratase
MLKLGHIIYSNTVPVHAGIISGAVAFPFTIVEGIPTALNRLLSEGKIDVSPSSSIEFAANPGRYLIMPGFSITSRNNVMSIILQSRLPMDRLQGKTVALTTASATSVVLLRILLELKNRVSPDYTLFEQGKDHPYDRADAVFLIGDDALKRPRVEGFDHEYDLGGVWHEFTGLPFVFALWQINYKKSLEKELASLYHILKESKAYGLSHLSELAEEHSSRLGIPATKLLEYWNSFSFDFGPYEQKGLMTYYGYAAEIGAVKPVTELRFWNKP